MEDSREKGAGDVADDEPPAASGVTPVGALEIVVLGSRAENAKAPSKKQGRTHKKSMSSGDKKPNTATCRICMEPVFQEEFLLGKSLKLGCKCSHGLEICHSTCARRWFKIRRCTLCEICEAEAIGLPKSVQREIKILAQRAEQASNVEPTLRFPLDLRSSHRTQSEELHLCTYTTFCLLPAALSAIFMVFFYFESLNLDVVQTMILAITVSSATMVHWLVEPNRPVWHMVFVLMFIGSIMGLSFMFVSVHRFGSLAACISGAIVGALLSVGVYTAVRAVATLLAKSSSENQSLRSESPGASPNTRGSIVY